MPLGDLGAGISKPSSAVRRWRRESSGETLLWSFYIQSVIRKMEKDFLTGFVWDRVKFLHCSLSGSMFWICADNSVDNTMMFELLLNSAYTASRPFLLLRPPHQQEG